MIRRLLAIVDAVYYAVENAVGPVDKRTVRQCIDQAHAERPNEVASADELLFVLANLGALLPPKDVAC